VDILSKAILKVNQDKGFQDRIRELGNQVLSLDAAQYAAYWTRSRRKPSR